MGNYHPVTVSAIKTGTQLARAYLYGMCKQLESAKDTYATRLLHSLTGDERLNEYPDLSYCTVNISKVSSSNKIFSWDISNGTIKLNSSSDTVSAICNSMYTEEFVNLSNGNAVTLSRTPSCIFIVLRNGLHQSDTQYTVSGNVITFGTTFGVSTGGGTINTEDIRVVYLAATNC